MIRKQIVKKYQARVQMAVGAGLLALVCGFAPLSYAHGNGGHDKWQPLVEFVQSILKRFKQVNETSPGEPGANCGYQATTGTYSVWPGGYLAWVDVKNVSGQSATDFEVLIDVGNATVNGHLAEFQQVENGYLVSAPSWLQWQKIRQGDKYRFQFIGQPDYEGVTPYIISINGVGCDTEAPTVSLAASSGFFNADGTLTLTAAATDNVAVRKVVFERGGEVVGVDWDAPFELDVDVDESLNGFHLYTATAYDPSGNQAATSDPERVFVAIDNKFFGTAPDVPADYGNLLTYFNQVTPGNAGKWGSVEATRDVMDWANLDTAYTFARNNGLRFKLHTLIWGQQQPGWIDDLTPEEQLAEIDEWMSLVAERYPDLEMIDVVNEPLHAPPSYTEALGGAGETGYDWVIKAFEMAREHFPNAQLILNDYQILHLPQFTQDYLVIINLLQERGLIDAIGVQAHFLERTQASMVQTNLDTLAATGLPIYATEFDLNLANDAQQANVMRDLFTVFWEHPAVVGVTHWGYLEGNTWQANAYLLRADGTQRPALDWLVCYLGGDADCPVPVYVPPGWHGDEFGVTLEAELYDTAEGLVALGDVVAFTDDGDWLSFAGVEFQAGWDTLWITYAKGNADVGSVTVHLDSLENAPVMTIPLEPTAGWGSFDTLEVPWDSLSGTHDVYIGFHDVFGVANVDDFRFGTPPPTSDVNLVIDGGFEGASVDGGWNAFGNSSVFTLTTGQAYDGAQSLQITNRSGTGGFAAYWLTDKVSAGTTYSVSAQVLHDGAVADTVRIVAKIACEGQADAYNWLVNNTAVEPNTWTELSGNLEVPADCDINEVQLFFEGTAEASIVYLDEVKVVPPPDANLVVDGGFEGGSLATGWSAFGSGATLSLSSTQFNSGAQSLLATGRSGTGGFAAYNLTDVMTPGLSYLASAWVYQNGAGPDTVRMVAKLGCIGQDDAYIWVNNNTAVPAVTWTQLSGFFNIPLGCDVNDVQLYFEGTAAGTNVYIDDVSVTLPAASLVTGGDFEGASLDGGWGTWWTGGTSLSLTTDRAFAGSQSLLANNRTANSHPSYNLTSLVEPGTSYAVSAQALHTGTVNDTLTMTYKLACAGEDDVYSQLQSAADVAPDTWTELSGNMDVPAGCDVNEARIYFEGTTTGVDVYLDEVSVLVN